MTVTEQDRRNAEEAVRAFPFWPLNRGPFVRLGVWFVLRPLRRRQP